MTVPRVKLEPDPRKRRIRAGELLEDAGDEYAERYKPTIRVWRDAYGPVVEIDGIPTRRREDCPPRPSPARPGPASDSRGRPRVTHTK